MQSLILNKIMVPRNLEFICIDSTVKNCKPKNFNAEILTSVIINGEIRGCFVTIF